MDNADETPGPQSAATADPAAAGDADTAAPKPASAEAETAAAAAPASAASVPDASVAQALVASDANEGEANDGEAAADADTSPPAEADAQEAGAQDAGGDPTIDPDKPPSSPQELRLKRPPAGFEAPPIDVVNMRAAPGIPQLIILRENDQTGGLALPDGEEGEAERCLGRGDTNAARHIGATLTDDAEPGADLTDRHVIGRSIIVRAHLMDGDLEAARVVMGGGRDDPRFALADAALALGEGDANRARDQVGAAMALRPAGVAEHYTLALIQVAEGQIPDAMVTLSKVSASVEEHAVARHQLGQLTLAAGDPARAGTLFEMSAELAPAFVPPSLALAEMLVDSRQYAEAMSVLGGVTERLPNALSPRLLQLRILVEVGEREAAASLADALKAAAPDHPEVVAMWADARLLAGHGEEARADLERLAALNAGEPKARLLRMLARIDLGAAPQRLDGAIGYLEEAIQNAPTPGELRLELAQVLLSMGAHDRATTALDELASDPRSDLSELLSGAVLARNHGLWACARRLGESGQAKVVGTPAESQVAGFLASLPETAD